jgi:hypothetical protein
VNFKASCFAGEDQDEPIAPDRGYIAPGMIADVTADALPGGPLNNPLDLAGRVQAGASCLARADLMADERPKTCIR